MQREIPRQPPGVPVMPRKPALITARHTEHKEMPQGYGGAVIARVRFGSKADIVVWSRRTHMDKTSKVIFALIAAGLWFDTASNLLRPAHAQQDMLSDIKVSVQLISRSLETLVSTAPTNGYVDSNDPRKRTLAQ